MITPQDYKNALIVQDACNLSGVVQSFAEVLTRMSGWPTDMRNTHPICKLYADKIADLAQVTDQSNKSFFRAWDECKKAAEEE